MAKQRHAHRHIDYSFENDKLYNEGVTKSDQTTRLYVHLRNEDTNRLVHEHFAYVNKELLKRFTIKHGVRRDDVKMWLIRWLKEDFNLDCPLASLRDIQVAKNTIAHHYKTVYPVIASESTIRRGGWTRIWISEHLIAEVKNEKFGF